MRYLIIVFIISFVCLSCKHPVSTRGGNATLLIENATIISPERMDKPFVGSVLIENERIAWVGLLGQSSPKNPAKKINAKGLFLIPGLIDGHVHLVDVPGVRDADKLRTDAVIRILVVAVAFYGMSTFEGPLMSIRSVSRLLRKEPI